MKRDLYRIRLALFLNSQLTQDQYETFLYELKRKDIFILGSSQYNGVPIVKNETPLPDMEFNVAILKSKDGLKSIIFQLKRIDIFLEYEPGTEVNLQNAIEILNELCEYFFNSINFPSAKRLGLVLEYFFKNDKAVGPVSLVSVDSNDLREINLRLVYENKYLNTYINNITNIYPGELIKLAQPDSKQKGIFIIRDVTTTEKQDSEVNEDFTRDYIKTHVNLITKENLNKFLS